MKKNARRILASLLCLCAGLAAVLELPALADGAPAVSAQAAALYVPDRQRFLVEKAARQKLPIASTTKIMTALLLCESAELSKTYTATAEMVTVEGSSMGLRVGDTVSAQALLYGMLLASGNDAANMTAYVLAGGLPAFARRMNEKAREIGMQDTNFVTPSGLDAEGHCSSARDMALLAAYALKNPAFREAAACQKKTVEYGNPPFRRTISNHNKLLALYDGATGVKTGFTKKSGRCLVSSAEKNGVLLVCVTLNAPSDWDDHQKLLDYGYGCVKRMTLPSGVEGKSVLLVGAREENGVVSLTADPPVITAQEEEFARVQRRYHLPPFLYAPVKKGAEVGSIEYYLDGQKLGAAKVYAADGAEAADAGAAYYGRRFLFWTLRLLAS